MNLTQSPNRTILLDQNAHRYAQQFASEQATTEKGEQVYLNTLSVYAVYTYLKYFSIPTALSQSDCWHSGLRAIFNVADLILPNLGKLECRWVLPREETILIPSEVRENRLGYIFLLFTEQLEQVELLGFLPGKDVNPQTESIAIDQLQSIDSFFDTIYRLRAQVNLNKWFRGFFSPDWQPVESILGGRMVRSSSGYSSAASVSRGKIIDLQRNNLKKQVILIVKATPKSTTEIEICLQIYPVKANENLPLGLQVKVLNRSGSTCLQAESKNIDDWIQLRFDCQKGENFGVQIIWGERKLINFA